MYFNSGRRAMLCMCIRFVSIINSIQKPARLSRLEDIWWYNILVCFFFVTTSWFQLNSWEVLVGGTGTSAIYSLSLPVDLILRTPQKHAIVEYGKRGRGGESATTMDEAISRRRVGAVMWYWTSVVFYERLRENKVKIVTWSTHVLRVFSWFVSTLFIRGGDRNHPQHYPLLPSSRIRM